MREDFERKEKKLFGFSLYRTLSALFICGAALSISENMLAQNKSKGNTELPDSVTLFNRDLSYSFSKKNYSNLYNFNKREEIQLDSVKYSDTPDFLGKFALSNPLTGSAALFYAPKLNNGFSLSTDASFQSFFGKLPSVIVDDKMMLVKSGKKVSAESRSLSLGADAGYSWEKGELTTYVKYMSGYYKCYGENVTMTTLGRSGSNSMNLFDAGVSARSLYSEGSGKGLDYNLSASYSGVRNRGLTDNYLHLHTSCSPKTKSNYSLTFGAELRLETALKRTGYESTHNNIYDFYAILAGKFSKIKYSIKGLFSLQSSNAVHGGKYTYPLFINADISIPLAGNALRFYGKAEGGNISNNFVSLVKENKMVSQKAAVLNGAVPLSIKGGFNGILNNRFSFDLYTGYALLRGMQQFVNYYGTDEKEENGTEFITAYSNHSKVMCGLFAAWSNRNIEIGITAEYNLYSNGKSGLINGEREFSGNHPIGPSPFNALFHFAYKNDDGWYITSSAIFRGRSWSGLEYVYTGETINGKPIDGRIKSSAYADLRIDFSYPINDNISLLFNCSNLLNSNIQYYSQYLKKGREIGAGVVVKF